MDNMWAMFLRTVLVYFLVFFTLKIMGKREIGKLSIFDLVIYIMIAEIGVFVIEDTKKPIVETLLPIGTLVVIQILLAYLTLKSQKLRDWVDGKPSFLISGGKLNREEMGKQRYNLDDLLVQLREKDVTDLSDVEYAILENSGKMSVVMKKEASAPGGIRYEGLPLPLIMDGKVQDDNLEKTGKTRFWLKNEMRSRNIKEFKDVFFCSIDHKGKLYFDLRRD